MDVNIYQALEEWAQLESAHFEARLRKDDGANQASCAAFDKAREIFDMRAQTREGALTHLRFCATFLQSNAEKGALVVGALRHAAGVLSLP